MTKTIINGSESELIVENKTPEIEITEARNKNDDNNNEQDLEESNNEVDNCIRYDMLNNSHLDKLNFSVIIN